MTDNLSRLSLSSGKEGKKVVFTAAGKKKRANKVEHGSELGVTTK